MQGPGAEPGLQSCCLSLLAKQDTWTKGFLLGPSQTAKASLSWLFEPDQSITARKWFSVFR